MKPIEKGQITGVILAGGRGSRMGGVDKGLVSVSGKRLVDHVLEALLPQVGKVLINANRNPQEYEALGQKVITDELTGFQGPLAGFASAMNAADTDFLLTLPCDAPKLAGEFVERLAKSLTEHEASIAVAHDGRRLQPVHALMRVDLLEDLTAYLEAGERKIDLWYARHPMVKVDFSDIPEMFDNINTPEQRDRLEREI